MQKLADYLHEHDTFPQTISNEHDPDNSGSKNPLEIMLNRMGGGARRIREVSYVTWHRADKSIDQEELQQRADHLHRNGEIPMKLNIEDLFLTGEDIARLSPGNDQVEISSGGEVSSDTTHQ